MVKDHCDLAGLEAWCKIYDYPPSLCSEQMER